MLFLCFSLSAAKASSFYDNPEQDPLPLEDTPEDLHKKWDFEVNLACYVFRKFYFVRKNREVQFTNLR